MTPIFSFSRADSSSLSDPLSDSSSLPDPLSDSLSLRLAVFETVIRLLGGLISAYDMSGDKALLDIAEDLGDRLVGVFDGERSGIATNRATLPMTRAHASDSERVLIAEAFSNLIEFGALGMRTGREKFQLKAEAGPRFMHARNDRAYLVGESVSRTTGRVKGKLTIGAPADSYYEYLLKYWWVLTSADTRSRALTLSLALRALFVRQDTDGEEGRPLA